MEKKRVEKMWPNDLLWTNTMQDIDVNDALNEFDMKFVTLLHSFWNIETEYRKKHILYR